MVKHFLLLILVAAGIYYFYPEPTLPPGTRIDKLVVLKADNKMLAYQNNILVKTYAVALGRAKGDKQVEGDLKTPEGLYYIAAKNEHSGYHKNLGISYPNDNDRKAAAKLGKSAGGDIKIHGLRNHTGFIGKFHRWFNWTLGCIAVTNEEVDELFEAVPLNTPIEIKP